MKEPLPMFLQFKRRDTGRDIFIFGLTMHYMKSWKQRQVVILSLSFPGIFLTLNSYRYVNTKKKSFVSFATIFAI